MADFQLDANAANMLAAIMHKASLGDTGSAIATNPSVATGQATGQQEGQAIIDRATTPDQTTTQPATTDTTAAAPTPGASADWEKAKVNQGYGVNGHPGIDLGVPVGTPLTAAEAGTITAAGNTDPGGYGNEVEITAADGTVMRYGHLSSINVKLGQQVAAGAPIGASGGAAGAAGSGNSTGAHLHFEVRKGGHSVDPVPYLAGNGGVVDGSGTQNAAAQSVAVDPEATAGANILAKAAGQPLHDTQIQQTPGQAATTKTGATGDTDPAALGSFLAAIRQHESGGNYQIYNQSGLSNASGAYQFLGSTWKGLGGSTAAAAQASPAEQDAIASRYAMQLFNQFHSWKLVAIAWYGGPGIAQQAAAGKNPGSPQGQGSYTAYGDTIAQMMQGGGKK